METRDLRFRTYLAWLLVFIVALTVRLIFANGVAHEESIAGARIGWEIAEALRAVDWQRLSESRGLYGIRVMVVFAPLSGLYLLAGVNDLTSLFIPFLLSLLNISIVMALASRLADAKAGLIAGLLWAVLPFDVYWANILSFYTPLVTLILFGLFLLLQSHSKRQTVPILGVIAYGFVLLIFEPLFGIYFLLLNLVYWASLQKKISLLWLGLLTGYIVAIISITPTLLFNTYLDWLGRPQAALLFVLMLAALSNHLLLEKQRSHFILAWLALAFLSLGIIDSLGGPFAKEAAILLLSAPQILLIAQYFSGKVSKEGLQNAVWILAPLLILVGWLGVWGQRQLTPNNSGPSWLSAADIFPALEILFGLLFFLAILSPRLLQGENPKFRNSFVLTMLAGVLLAQLPAIWKLVRPQYQLARAAQTAWRELEAQDLVLPVQVNDNSLFELLAYISGFSLDDQLRLFEKRNQIEDAYVFIYENSLPEIPKTWWQIGVFGPLGQPRLTLYRALSSEEATRQLLVAQKGVEIDPDAKDYFAQHAALMNVGETCSAYEAWLQAQWLQADPGGYLLIDPGNDCQFPKIENSLINWPVEQNSLYAGYLVLREGDAENSIRLNKRYNFFYDPRIFNLNYLVDPNTVYRYQAEVRSNGSVMALYWNMLGYENYASAGVYREWQKISVLFVTPPQNDMQEISVSLSPVLFEHFDFVEVRNVQLQKIGWPE